MQTSLEGTKWGRSLAYQKYTNTSKIFFFSFARSQTFPSLTPSLYVLSQQTPSLLSERERPSQPAELTSAHISRKLSRKLVPSGSALRQMHKHLYPPHSSSLHLASLSPAVSLSPRLDVCPQKVALEHLIYNASKIETNIPFTPSSFHNGSLLLENTMCCQ